MNSIKYLLFLLVVVSTNGFSHHVKLIDPWGPVRELCRKQLGLTREELRDLQNQPYSETLGAYGLCFAGNGGFLNQDKTINPDAFIKGVLTLSPLVLAVPITKCCMSEVYGGGKTQLNEGGRGIIGFTFCWRSKIPELMWRAMGGFEKPVYPPVDQCPKW